jgi:hypothetical protein
MQAEAARFHRVVSAPSHLMKRRFLAVIAQSHSDARPQTFHRQDDQLIIAQLISMTNDVSAGLIHAENHQHPLFLAKRVRIQEFAHLIPHQDQIAGMAAELDLLFLHRVREKAEHRFDLVQVRTREGERSPRRAPTQKLWTVQVSSCSVSRMWKVLMALSLGVAPAIAQENVTAYDALRVVGNQYGKAAVNHVISVSGVHGNPQPETWHVVLEGPGGHGIREVEVTNGELTETRGGSHGVVGSAEGAKINTHHLNLDSSGAYSVASYTADKSNAHFSNVDYTLRTDERGEPVWIVTLHSRSGRPVGTIHIGANRGNVTRTEGMFAGATMEDVETDQVADEDGDTHNGPFSGTRARIRAAILRAQDQARGMFDRVRRSFVDFINRA